MSGGLLPANVMHFARLLRAVGIPAGPGRVLDALGALSVVDLTRRDECYWALHAVFVSRHDQREVFDEAFRVFFRDPGGMEAFLAMFLPRQADDPVRERLSRRMADALAGEHPAKSTPGPDAPVEVDALLTWSDEEVLRHRDFEQMSAEEVALARKVIAKMRLTRAEVPIRRTRRSPRGDRIDPRATLRATLRAGATIPLVRRRRQTRAPPLVVLCDVSGSMARYARVLMHFLHALTSDRDRVHTFVFGTRLTNVTRTLRDRDVDVALARVGAQVQDWEGGTRIGESLREFDRHWSRRVLGQGAVVLLITDGLDRGEPEVLGREMARLHRSCRKLLWLNPLLRFAAFEPRARGPKAMLPHVDAMKPIHDLDSLEQLAKALAEL